MPLQSKNLKVSIAVLVSDSNGLSHTVSTGVNHARSGGCMHQSCGRQCSACDWDGTGMARVVRSCHSCCRWFHFSPKARAPLLDVKYHTGWKQISANEFLGAFFTERCKESLTHVNQGFMCFSRWMWSSRCGETSGDKCYMFAAFLIK